MQSPRSAAAPCPPRAPRRTWRRNLRSGEFIAVFCDIGEAAAHSSGAMIAALLLGILEQLSAVISVPCGPDIWRRSDLCRDCPSTPGRPAPNDHATLRHRRLRVLPRPERAVAVIPRCRRMDDRSLRSHADACHLRGSMATAGRKEKRAGDKACGETCEWPTRQIDRHLCSSFHCKLQMPRIDQRGAQRARRRHGYLRRTKSLAPRGLKLDAQRAPLLFQLRVAKPPTPVGLLAGWRFTFLSRWLPARIVFTPITELLPAFVPFPPLGGTVLNTIFQQPCRPLPL